MALFPYLGTVGYSNRWTANHRVRVYGNNEWRRYVRSNAVRFQKRVSLQFNDYTQAKVDTIVAFMEARWNAAIASPNDFAFTMYNPFETYVMTGTTGYYNAIFEHDEFEIENVGFCTYNLQLEFLLLSAAV